MSFTKNLGGLKNAHRAIRTGFAPSITVAEFKDRTGLGDQALIITQFFLGAQVSGADEVILSDSLITQTLSQPYSRLTARLYFFALNLNLPGQRLRTEQQNAAEIQNELVRNHLFVRDGFRVAEFEKDSIQGVVGRLGKFKNAATLRKWVNNYSHIAEQCGFVPAPDGGLETFPDTWGPLALRLFFERYSAVNPAPDSSALISAGQSRELHKLIGVPRSWLEDRLPGAAEMFLSDEAFMLAGFKESVAERKAAKRGAPPPPSSGESLRREITVQRIERRGENVRFIHDTYGGQCQLSGVKLIMPDGSFSADCAHIWPLGRPHCGKDDVNNMLSLSPTMHRLFDRGCVRIDPHTLAISLRHGNDVPHLPHLLVREAHVIDPRNLSYYLAKILK
jgi:hypothetical protein